EALLGAEPEVSVRRLHDGRHRVLREARDARPDVEPVLRERHAGIERMEPDRAERRREEKARESAQTIWVAQHVRGDRRSGGRLNSPGAEASRVGTNDGISGTKEDERDREGADAALGAA